MKFSRVTRTRDPSLRRITNERCDEEQLNFTFDAFAHSLPSRSENTRIYAQSDTIALILNGLITKFLILPTSLVEIH